MGTCFLLFLGVLNLSCGKIWGGVAWNNGIQDIQVTAVSANQGQSAESVSFPNLPNAGDTIVLFVWSKDTISIPTYPYGSAIDNQGNTYIPAVQAGNVGVSHLGAAIYYLTNIPPSTGTFTITVTPTGSSPQAYITMGAIEYSGIQNINPLDQTTSNNLTNTTTPNTGTAPQTTQSYELVVALTSVTATGETFSPAPGFIPEITELSPTINTEPGQVVDQVVANIGTYSASWIIGVLGNTTSALVTFKSASPPP